MAAMNRWYYLYSESYLSAHLDEIELSYGFMDSSMDKYKRGNCVIDMELQ